MAKVFGMIAEATTGFTAIGTIRSYEKTTQAEVKYSKAATGAPDKSNVVAGPTTMSAEVEVSGTAPIAGTTEITIGSVVYHTTKCTEKYSGDGDVYTADVEGSIKIA